jgi:hypothetical protein
MFSKVRFRISSFMRIMTKGGSLVLHVAERGGAAPKVAGFCMCLGKCGGRPSHGFMGFDCGCSPARGGAAWRVLDDSFVADKCLAGPRQKLAKSVKFQGTPNRTLTSRGPFDHGFASATSSKAA